MPKGGFFGSNYSHIMDEMTPEGFAGLISKELYLNSCEFCTQKSVTPCDRQCYKHVLEWLDWPFDEAGKNLIKGLDAWEEINE